MNPITRIALLIATINPKGLIPGEQLPRTPAPAPFNKEREAQRKANRMATTKGTR